MEKDNMIPINTTKLDDKKIRNEIIDSISQVENKSWFILGENLKRFEDNFAKYCNRKYCIGVNSGTDALFIALKAAGIKENDEVITVSNSFIATALVVSNLGAKPVFVDIDKESYNMDTNKIRAKITSRTKAIIPVHLYGQPADLENIIEIANKSGLFILEDCCQAHGAERNGIKVPISGTGCFSFYPAKNLGGYGDGGCIVTDDKKIADNARLLRNYGEIEKYKYKIKGFNSRLDEIQSAILNVKLKYLDMWNEKRISYANLYNSLLKDIVITPYQNKRDKHVYHLYVIRCKNRDELQEHLKKNGIGTLIHYPIPIHKQESYKEYNKEKLPVTEKYTKEILSLPMYPDLREKEISFICDKIKEFYK